MDVLAEKLDHVPLSGSFHPSGEGSKNDLSLDDRDTNWSFHKMELDVYCEAQLLVVAETNVVGAMTDS